MGGWVDGWVGGWVEDVPREGSVASLLHCVNEESEGLVFGIVADVFEVAGACMGWVGGWVGGLNRERGGD